MGKPVKILSSIRKKIEDDREAKAAAARAAAAKEVQAANSLQASKEQVGKQAELSAARQAAEGAAREASSAPVGNVDVRIGSAEEEQGGDSSVKKRRTRFGIGTESSGVNI